MPSNSKNKSSEAFVNPRGVVQRIARRYQTSKYGLSSSVYNLTSSSAPKFLWFRVAKAGTRSILNHFLDNHVEFTFNASHLIYTPERYKDYFKFGFVRNPWDRIVSCWANKVVDSNYFNFSPEQLSRYQDFSMFLEHVESMDLAKCDVHLRRQVNLIDLGNIDFIGRMENFDVDHGIVSDRLGLSRSLKRVNASKRKSNYHEYYTTRSRELVERLYEADIRTFNYHY